MSNRNILKYIDLLVTLISIVIIVLILFFVTKRMRYIDADGVSKACLMKEDILTKIFAVNSSLFIVLPLLNISKKNYWVKLIADISLLADGIMMVIIGAKYDYCLSPLPSIVLNLSVGIIILSAVLIIIGILYKKLPIVEDIEKQE